MKNYAFDQNSIPYRFGVFFVVLYVLAVIAFVIAFSTYSFAYNNICFVLLASFVNVVMALGKSGVLSKLSVRDTTFFENYNSERVKKANFIHQVGACSAAIYFVNYTISTFVILTFMLLFNSWWDCHEMNKLEFMNTMLVNSVCGIFIFLFGNYIAHHTASVFKLSTKVTKGNSLYDFDLNKYNVEMLGDKCENYATTIDYNKTIPPLWTIDLIWLWAFCFSIGLFAGKLIKII